MIELLSIPPLASVQDLGRDGYWAQGLGRAGAMDLLGHSIANLLLGNAPGDATIEIPLTPAKFSIIEDGALALVGAACNAKLDDRYLPRAWAGPVRAGQTLSLGPVMTGARVYLALPGGINVAQVLGSRSTQLREGFGGYDGRVLASGDVLRASGTSTCTFPQGGISVAIPSLYSTDGSILIRALASSEHDSFNAEARTAFWSTPYKVTNQCNRQGYRLEGATLDRMPGKEMRSHGIGPGIVQVPGGGQPIIQLADSATMGGYPKIAAVIEADLWRIAQAKCGEKLRFEQVDLEVAAQASADHDSWIADLQRELNVTETLIRSWS